MFRHAIHYSSGAAGAAESMKVLGETKTTPYRNAASRGMEGDCKLGATGQLLDMRISRRTQQWYTRLKKKGKKGSQKQITEHL
jgi:hypothetical protein